MVARINPHTILDEGMKRWIYNQAHRNLWRVSGWVDIDDLIQDGFMCYVICKARYQPKNRDHFMSLVKITFINHITDLANKRTRTPESPICDIAEAGNDQELLENLAGSDNTDAEVISILARASKEVRLILSVISTDAGAAMLRQPVPIRPDGTRETTNERFCRVAGIPTFDFEGAVRQLLKPAAWDWSEELVNRLFVGAI